MNELDLFTEALSRTDPAERAAFLDQACAGNPELRRRLEKLLAGHAQAENPLDRPPVAPGEFGATVEQPTPSSTRAYPPEVATQAFDHTRSRCDIGPRIGRQRTPYDRVEEAPDRPGPQRRLPSPIPMPPRQRHGCPAQPGLRWTNGSERSSPAGTRWSR